MTEIFDRDTASLVLIKIEFCLADPATPKDIAEDLREMRDAIRKQLEAANARRQNP